MTEAEWLACEDPEAILNYFAPGLKRQRRLLACACCRLGLHYLSPETEFDPCRDAVEVAERFADGLESVEIRHRTLEPARKAYRDAQCAWAESDGSNPPIASLVVIAACACVANQGAGSATYAMGYMLRLEEFGKSGFTSRDARELIRDVFGNPFRPVALDPLWLTFDVQALSRGIYDERAFERLPILADALEDAGCENPEVLSHCRGNGPHVRGCWVLDLLLGKR